MTAGLRLVPPPIQLTDAPPPDWSHIARLSDDTGLLEHSRNAIVRREHGYCVDDVSRGLLVASREPQPTGLVVRLAERYLAFLTHAQDSSSGAFRNRFSYGRTWEDSPSFGDWWGRALWGLGTAAARSTVPWIRREALNAFLIGCRGRSSWPRAMAFAGLGAAEVLRSGPSPEAASLLGDAATVIGLPGKAPWVWPEQSLTYANPCLAEVLISAGDLLGDEDLLHAGLRSLAWLCREQEHEGHLSTVPVGGWRPGVAKHRFDQQPIEAAAVADACATALAATGDPRWEGPLWQAIAWFLGDNDQQIIMYDPLTGGCYDGLMAEGPNVNQGAESTLALVSTLQHARTLATHRATRP
ncbi:glycosyltransferase [Actinoplanes sp. TBRC 11911]|uniref:glycosyltransferase n=1 Tax=Actinoplanes sp. TBRC 11911 TaxID=2729386 RepID=UPI001B7D5843|nr:glycosyltransferase [Actinoplanes sp. TBRC 11911]